MIFLVLKLVINGVEVSGHECVLTLLTCSNRYEDNWYEANLEQEKISCTREEMKLAAERHLTTEALNWNQDNQRTISGMVE